MVLRSSFELFEVMPDGTAAPRGLASTVEDAWKQLRLLSRNTNNECFALRTPTRRIIGHLNVPSASARTTKRIYQITYAHEMALEREQVMRDWGYRVTTAAGNENAKSALA
ncbi:MAG TPA: hypothetical protein VJN21_12605 [Candidatus Acidoferrales bacterium]|nr:hypothetical protein [Candidatus Acidoferrales bacterium]